MRPNPNRGRVYRRCGCRDTNGRQLGARCPHLANPRHGNWAFAVDMPSPDHNRKTMRRSGHGTRSDARAALARVLECERAGVILDDAQTVADYLVGWLDAKARRLKPTTVARYRDYLHNDLMPAFGAVRLERLTHQHVDHFVRGQLAAGRGPVTLRRCISTLSSALNDGIRQRRLTHNAARYTAIPVPRRIERPCWTAEEAAAFLRHCHRVDDPLTELYELLICTGMRRGEALGLHWADVDLQDRLLYVRHTLVTVDNSRLVFNAPKLSAVATGSPCPPGQSTRYGAALPATAAKPSPAPRTTTKGSSSAARTDSRSVPSTCCATSTTSRTPRGCPASGSTTCVTSLPPS